MVTDDTSASAEEQNLWNDLPSGRVLLVEPDEDIARMLEVRLAREGHDVVVARTGQEALRVVLTHDLDIALVDRKLQDVAALELMKQLQDQFAPFETILMTVDPTVELFVEGLEAGAFDMVIKPFANLKLVTCKVDKAVAKVQAERDRNELARMLHQQTSGISAPPTPTAEEEPMLGAIDLNGMSGVDPLTGLPNKQAADERFRTETARALRYDRPLCVALASIDDLDAVVGNFGHDVADGVIRGIVQIFSGLVRDVDFIARRQGGEFFFLFPETTKDSGYVVIDRIRQKLIQTSFSNFLGDDATGEGFRISASFGLAGLPADTMNAEILRSAAESALSRAKASGGDQVVRYEASMTRRA